MTYRRFLPSALCVIGVLALTVAGCGQKYTAGSIGAAATAPPPPGALQSCISSSPSPLPSAIASLFTAAVARTKAVPGGAIGFYQNGTSYTYYWGYADQGTGTCMGPSSVM